MGAYLGLGGRGDDGVLELLVLAHAVGDGYSADLAGSVLVSPPRAAGQVAPDDHLYGQTLALVAYGHHGIGRGYLPVLYDVGCGIQEHGGYLVEHLSLIRYSLGQDDVKCRDPVSSYHRDVAVVDSVDVADFPLVLARLMAETECGLCNCFHGVWCFIIDCCKNPAGSSRISSTRVCPSLRLWPPGIRGGYCRRRNT